VDGCSPWSLAVRPEGRSMQSVFYIIGVIVVVIVVLRLAGVA
jgi:hypothetical protein